MVLSPLLLDAGNKSCFAFILLTHLVYFLFLLLHVFDGPLSSLLASQVPSSLLNFLVNLGIQLCENLSSESLWQWPPDPLFISYYRSSLSSIVLQVCF